MSARRKRWVRRGLLALVVVAGAATAGIAYHQHCYPYGWSHCCDKFLILQLEEYADSHDGWYPRGEATPEGSLSLLYRRDNTLANLLRGKTVPMEVVRERLNGGELLTPETCGWHYVEGLRKGDDPALALFWDKAGLGHNGERRASGARTVWFINCSSEEIPGERWDAFLAEQELLRGKLNRPR
ncbi:MAG TPA: hypothetical protein VGI99_14725 [Gemmataceae bacterium]|jgi:hypothetical protein